MSASDPVTDQPQDGAPAEAAPDPRTNHPAEAYVIPFALAQATLNYLAAQPYREVYTLVQAFEALEPLQAPPAGPSVP